MTALRTMRPGELEAELERRLAAAQTPRARKPARNVGRKRSGLTAMITVAFMVVFGAMAVTGVHDLDLFELDENAIAGVAAGDDWSLLDDGTGDPNNDDSALVSVFLNDSDAPTDVTYFTGGGSKDINDVTEWEHSDTDVAPDKDEILDAFAAAYNDSGDLIIYFGLDRYADNGDAQVGFWFFQSPVGLNADGSFAGAHEIGDLLVLSDFTNGGNIAHIDVYQWVGSGGDTNGTLDTVATGVECEIATGGDFVCAESNEGTETAPWPYTPKFGDPGTFPSGTFYEGGLNLTALGLDIGCGGSFLAETRSSQEATAQLKDFALGTFALCGLEVTKTGDELGKIGDPADYTIEVENTGVIDLYAEDITDTLLGDLLDPTNPFVTSDDCGPAGTVLAPSDTCTITATRTIQAGDPDPLPNTVTATYDSNAALDGTDVTDSDSHSVNLFQPSVTIDKSGTTLSKVGDDVTYDYLITNTSSADSPDLILDSLVDAGDNNGGAGLGDLTSLTGYDTDCDELASGESCSFSITYTVLAGDDDPLNNTVTVHYHPDGFPNDITDSDDHEVNLFQPSVDIDKTGDELGKVGDAVNYTITVTNTSSADSPDLSCDISDAMLGIDKQDVILGPGDTDVTNDSYVVQAADPDPLENTASVTCTVVGFGNVIGPETDSHSVNLFQPSVTIDKTGPTQAGVGDTVTYMFTITNTSSADSPDLILVSVIDTVIGDITGQATTGGCGTLAPAGSCNFTADYTILGTDPSPLVNVVTALYNPEGFPNEITDSDDHSLEIVGGEGCTPGFWKTHTDLWDASGSPDLAPNYNPGDDFYAAFGITVADGGSLPNTLTLEQALNLQGGGIKALARHAAAALLNSDSSVDYPYSTADVIDIFRDGIGASTLIAPDEYTLQEALAALSTANELGCPFGAGGVVPTSSVAESSLALLPGMVAILLSSAGLVGLRRRNI